MLRRRSPHAVVLVALALLVAACGGGSKHNTTPPVTRPKVLALSTSVLKVGKVDVESAGPNVQIDTTTGRAVLAAAQSYIDNAVFAPLRVGTIGAGYGALFDPGVKAAAIGADRSALTDLDVGKVTSLTTKASPVELSALVGTLGELMYVATDFDLTMKGTVASGRFTMSRHVELTFAQTGKAWLVTAYRVNSVRTSVAGTTTTTARAGTTTP